MINVYTIGHGYLLNVKNAVFETPVALDVYVQEDNLYDGPLTKNLIDEGKFEPPQDEHAYKGYPKTINKKEKTYEHYFVTTDDTRKDVEKVKGWMKASKSPIDIEVGKLYKLADDKYVVMSVNAQAVRLSDLIGKISKTLGEGKYHLHWTACRTAIAGTNDKELIEEMNSGSKNVASIYKG